MNAREVAARVLVRVWDDGAYAAAALSAELGRTQMDPRERGLATEISYGVLRTQAHLERRLAAYGKLKHEDRDLMAHLLVAAYQLEFLDRVPPHAAVDEAVTLISRARSKRLGGFANAVLRRLAAMAPAQKLSLAKATLESTPSWITKRLVRAVGMDATLGLLVPERGYFPTLRVEEPVPSGAFSEWLSVSCVSVDGVSGAYRYQAGGDPRRRPEFAKGAFTVQELGAQLVAHALGARPGEIILDACAGRGQKTALLRKLVGPSGRVVATDIHEHKVRALEDEMARLHWDVDARIWDFTVAPPEELIGAFDRVLVDAPCTGLGTLSRRPEMSRRLSPDDPKRLGELQLSILRNAALAVRPGGTLLFATCSVLTEESEDVVGRAFMADVAEGGLEGFVPSCAATPVDGILFPAGALVTPSFRLLPHVHGTDGYFVARFVRTLG